MEKKIFIKKIKEAIKEFKSLPNLKKVILILAILFVLAFLILSFYTFFVLFIFSTQATYISLLEPLGFDFQKPISTFALWGSFLILILSINILIKKRFNPYFWAGIFISLFLIIFGLSFIGETYKYDLPSSIFWKSYGSNILDKNSNCSYSRLDCQSVKDKINFVEGDEVYCNFKLNENCSFYISNFTVDKNYLNSKDFVPLETEINKNYIVFRFKVEKSLESIWVRAYISNGSYSDSPFWTILELDEVYSDEEYLSLKQTKTLVIISLISISLFSTFVAINNLRQIIEGYNKDRRNKTQ